MSRRVYLLGVGLALVALALAVTDWALSLRPGVTEANVKRIRPGMTLAEVGALFGRAPDAVFEKCLGVIPPCRLLCWGHKELAVSVVVEDNRVSRVSWSRSRPAAPPGPLAR